jgi:hypothetical protein
MTWLVEKERERYMMLRLIGNHDGLADYWLSNKNAGLIGNQDELTGLLVSEWKC